MARGHRIVLPVRPALSRARRSRGRPRVTAILACLALSAALSAAAQNPRSAASTSAPSGSAASLPTASPTSLAGAAPQGLSSLDACIQRLDPQVDIGFDRIAARCPELVRQLQQSAWAAWLPHGWQEPGNDLSAGSLKELRELAGRELVAGRSGRTPDIHRLNEVLSEQANSAAGRGSWWLRFKSWLRSILESRQPARGESWITRMIAQAGFSQAILELLSYSALAVVVALAGLIVVNELRAAGLLAKGLRGRARTGAQVDRREMELAWGDIERVPFGDRPRLLLELIATRLNDRRFLPPFGALTVRELTRAAHLPEPEDRTRLREVALAAERVRFSGRDITADGLQSSLIRGRELLDRLNVSDGGSGNGPGAAEVPS